MHMCVRERARVFFSRIAALFLLPGLPFVRVPNNPPPPPPRPPPSPPPAATLAPWRPALSPRAHNGPMTRGLERDKRADALSHAGGGSKNEVSGACAVCAADAAASAAAAEKKGAGPKRMAFFSWKEKMAEREGIDPGLSFSLRCLLFLLVPWQASLCVCVRARVCARGCPRLRAHNVRASIFFGCLKNLLFCVVLFSLMDKASWPQSTRAHAHARARRERERVSALSSSRGLL